MARKYKKNWNKEKKGSKTKLFTQKNVMGILIVFIMVSSAVGFGYMMSQDESFDYKGTEIDRIGASYASYFDYNGDEISFRSNYHPDNVDYLELDKSVLDKIKAAPSFMIMFDTTDEYLPDVELARSNIEGFYRDNGGKAIGSFVTEQNLGAYAYYPVATCVNATDYIPGVYIKTNDSVNETGFSVEGSCLIFNARDDDDIKALSARLMYGLTGIIK